MSTNKKPSGRTSTNVCAMMIGMSVSVNNIMRTMDDWERIMDSYLESDCHKWYQQIHNEDELLMGRDVDVYRAWQEAERRTKDKYGIKDD
jgi:hypothetical protein